MRCPRCNNDLRPGALFCDRCGAQFRSGEIPAAPQQPYAAKAAPVKPADSAAKKKSSTKKRVILAVVLATVACLLIAGGIVLAKTVILPNKNYQAAMDLKNAGKYEEAIVAFEEMDGYKDSEAMIKDCYYEEAKNLYNTGRYEEAIVAFESLGDYKESVSMMNSCQYLTALDLYNTGDYEGALAEFNDLGGYDEQVDLCNRAIAYDEAMALYNAGKYTEAMAAFEALGDYSDSADYVKKCNTALLKDTAVGDYIVFGSYEQDNNTANGKEEIEWLVLDRRGDSVLLVSRYALDCQVFYPYMSNITWDTSSIRSWLNSTFLNSAFSASEQNMIELTSVTADRNPKYNTYPGTSTNDKVFLLSASEVGWYFSTDSAMQCKGTQYCYAQGAYVGTNSNCWWWLRTPGDRISSAATVSSAGGIHYSGNDVDAIAGAIRPAIWLSLG